MDGKPGRVDEPGGESINSLFAVGDRGYNVTRA